MHVDTISSSPYRIRHAICFCHFCASARTVQQHNALQCISARNVFEIALQSIWIMINRVARVVCQAMCVFVQVQHFIKLNLMHFPTARAGLL